MTRTVLGEPAAAPEEIREALTILIEYLWDDERRAFEECAAQDPEMFTTEHIFIALCYVRTWLEGRCYEPQQFMPPEGEFEPIR